MGNLQLRQKGIKIAVAADEPVFLSAPVVQLGEGKSLGFAQEYMFEKGSLNPGNTWLENGIMSRGNQGHEMVQSHSYILR